MYRIALSSTGPYVGKSTLARVLANRYGYVIASHSNTLVELYCENFNRSWGTDLTPLKVYANKADHRKGLQEFARLIEFDRDTRYVERTLDAEWAWRGEVPVVFDSVRSNAQGLFLRHMDFKLVNLEVPYAERVRRAAEQGCSKEKLDLAMQDKAERGIDPSLFNATMNAMLTPYELAAVIMSLYMGTGTIERVG